MSDDIGMRESQLFFVELQRRWDGEENRTFALIRQLEDAEKLLNLLQGQVSTLEVTFTSWKASEWASGIQTRMRSPGLTFFTVNA